MGNTISLVVNNTAQDISIKEWKKKYCKDLKEIVEYSTDEGENLGPGKHACFSPSKLKKGWKRRQRLMGISSEIRVSFKGKNSNEGVVLSVSEFESNAGIVLNIGENNQLVKEPVSREEAKMIKQTKSSGKYEQELKQHLLSIVKKRNTASTSQPQQGEGEKLDQGSEHEVTG